MVGSAVAGFLYWRGLRVMRAQRGPARDYRAVAFWTGLALLFLALVSPLDGLDLRWQWVHMLQHVILLVGAPPLILLGDPFTTAWAGLRSLRSDIGPPPSWWTRAVDALRTRRGGALLVLGFFCVDLLAWHVPALYNLTLQVEWVHDLEHTLFLVSGLLFWDVAITEVRTRAGLSLTGRAAFVLTGMIVSWALAIVIGYASHPLYAYPVQAGLSPLQDQQIAAGIMWVPSSIPFVAALVYLGAVWFDFDERAAATLS